MPPRTAANTRIVSTIGSTVATPAPWASSPKPRRNCAWGVSRLIEASVPPDCAIGKHRPTERAEQGGDDCLPQHRPVRRSARRWRCTRSSRWPRRHTRGRAARRRERRPSGRRGSTWSPRRALVVLRRPSTRLVNSLPTTIARRDTDAASRRASVPWLRSSMMLVKPNWTVRKRKRIGQARGLVGLQVEFLARQAEVMELELLGHFRGVFAQVDDFARRRVLFARARHGEANAVELVGERRARPSWRRTCRPA